MQPPDLSRSFAVVTGASSGIDHRTIMMTSRSTDRLRIEGPALSPKHATFRTSLRGALLLLGLLVLPQAHAQSTGNPKGSVAPSTQGAPSKPAANPQTPSANGSPGPILDSSRGPASARTQRTVPPGGGPAGGLTQRNPQDADPSAQSSTDKSSAGSQAQPASR